MEKIIDKFFLSTRVGCFNFRKKKSGFLAVPEMTQNTNYNKV